MPVFTLLTVIVLIMEISGQSVRYVVTCTPNWNHIYTGESVTLTCDVGPNENINDHYIYWYKDNEIIQREQHEFIISQAKYPDAGDYECSSASGVRSHVFTLYVADKGYNKFRVTFSPNYRNIFVGEEMTMSCETGPSASRNQKYVWYKDGNQLMTEKKDIKTYSARREYSGIFECGVQNLNFPVRLDVSDDVYIILQYPPNILEGDSVDLRCHSNPYSTYSKADEKTTIFYKDGAIIIKSKEIFHLPSATKSMSGIYRCEKTAIDGEVLKAEEIFVFVQDLFTRPEIKAPDNIKEGDALTLTCDTRRNPLREDTELRFTFYRNGQEVISSNSNTYQIQSAQLEDSGNYTCEVRTVLGTVMKMSDVTPIRITAAVNKPNLKLLPNKMVLGDDIILRCESSKGSLPIYYLFYHNETLFGNMTIHQKGAAELRLTVRSLTMGGLYYCASYNDFQTQHQQSAADNLLVVEPVADISITADTEGEGYVLGQSLTLTCSVRRGTSISIFWWHNETSVEEDSEFYQLQDNGKILSIHSLQYHHEGTYRCCAKNKLSVNRTFSVLSEIRSVNILKLNAAGLITIFVFTGFFIRFLSLITLSSPFSSHDRSIQWIVPGIGLLVIILAYQQGRILTMEMKVAPILTSKQCKLLPPTQLVLPEMISGRLPTPRLSAPNSIQVAKRMKRLQGYLTLRISTVPSQPLSSIIISKI
ncbi:Fc receptor-like protein 5 [Eleutherodactylus coqui]|uniref:Fc receptor-like protein 5 n=1 Tax=Eleutherodactylus coqui TaxID=57060 RepID=UPI0034628209